MRDWKSPVTETDYVLSRPLSGLMLAGTAVNTALAPNYMDQRLELREGHVGYWFHRPGPEYQSLAAFR